MGVVAKVGTQRRRPFRPVIWGGSGGASPRHRRLGGRRCFGVVLWGWSPAFGLLSGGLGGVPAMSAGESLCKVGTMRRAALAGGALGTARRLSCGDPQRRRHQAAEAWAWCPSVGAGAGALTPKVEHYIHKLTDRCGWAYFVLKTLDRPLCYVVKYRWSSENSRKKEEAGGQEGRSGFSD